jgi:hypothetical protein
VSDSKESKESEMETTFEQSVPRPRGRPALPAWLHPDGPAFVWIGLLAAAAGFVLIAVSWAQVAGETLVYLQLPYLVSGGIGGLALVMLGVTLVNVAAKRRDALERARQADQLVAILEELKLVLAGDDGDGDGR